MVKTNQKKRSFDSPKEKIVEQPIEKRQKEATVVHRCRFIHYLSAPIVSMSLSNEYLAVGRQNGTIQLWNPRGNIWFHEKTIPGVKNDLEVVCWAGNRLFSAGLGGIITEYNLTTLLPSFTTSSFGGAVWSMQVNPSQQVLAVGCEDGVVRLFRIVENGLEYLSALERQSSRVVSLAWHPHKPIIVCGSTEGFVRAIHADTGRTVHRMMARKEKGQDTIIWSVLVLKDGTIVTGDSLGTVSFWHGKKGVLIKSIICHDADVLCLAGNSDGTVVFSSGVDRRVTKLVYVEETNSWVINGHKRYQNNDVRSLLYLEDRKWDAVLSGGVETGLIMSFPTAEFDKMYQRRLGFIPNPSPISVAKDRRMVMCMNDESLQVFKIGTKQILAFEAKQGRLENGQKISNQRHRHLLTINVKGETNNVSSDVSRNGELIVVSDAYKIKLFRIIYDIAEKPTVQAIHEQILDELPGALMMKFSPDGSKLAVVGTDSVIYLVDVELFTLITKFTTHKSGYESNKWNSATITNVIFSSDGKYLVSGDSSRRIVSHSLNTFKVQVLPKFTHMHTSFSVDPKESVLCVTTTVNEIYLIDLTTNTLTDWSRQCSHQLPSYFTSRTETILGVVFGIKPNVLLVYGNSYTHVIDLNEIVGQNDVWKIDHRYQSLIYCDKIEDELVVIERPYLQMLSELPDAFNSRLSGI
ncbi:U3 small nucleolar RNA-associated protein [Boothiomyces macroporosus]|uniref:U3 small nucleolar RNA-associated protein n=1 Tax=Boothiomyces macroporosus TaxID=261099 RepID=A0AAD5UB72_9FUNG|nr:U3 small nucleolar RNA-associated protein [Boothiomyces macroporosus]